MKNSREVILVSVLSLTLVSALPKIETPEKGFVPSKAEYFHVNGDQVAMESKANLTAEASERPARFGFPTYSTDVQNYPGNVNNVVPGVYGPVKLDIGGLVLGTIVGLGAFFILPKLLHVVSGPYGGFKRSEDDGQESSLGLNEMVVKLQDSLASYNIDSKACVQRALCSSIQSANEKITKNSANTFDNVVDVVAKNDMVKTYVDGTDWQKVIDVAKSGDNCSVVFAKCPFSVDSVVSTVSKYLSTS